MNILLHRVIFAVFFNVVQAQRNDFENDLHYDLFPVGGLIR